MRKSTTPKDRSSSRQGIHDDQTLQELREQVEAVAILARRARARVSDESSPYAVAIAEALEAVHRWTRVIEALERRSGSDPARRAGGPERSVDEETDPTAQSQR